MDVIAAAEPSAPECISVVMPVRNALPYLSESIASILGQTHEDFEFVIGDDGSTDGSSQVLREWAGRDPRIRLFARQECSGPVRSSNWVVECATKDVIARMDADDIAHPDRLRRQLAVLRANEDAVLVGSLWDAIGAKGRRIRGRNRYSLVEHRFGGPFAHGTIMFRRKAFEQIGGYRPGSEYWEDLDLYMRMAGAGRILVLPDALYTYRFAETSARLTSAEERVEQAADLMYRCRDCYLAGGDYGALLQSAGESLKPARVTPQAFLSISAGRIWSGQTSGMIKRMWRRGSFPKRPASLLAWGILLWASVSPSSLRLLLKWRVQIMDSLAAHRFEDGRPYEFRCRPVAPSADTVRPSKDVAREGSTWPRSRSAPYPIDLNSPLGEAPVATGNLCT